MYLKGVNKYKKTSIFKRIIYHFFSCIFFVFSFLNNTSTKKIHIKPILKGDIKYNQIFYMKKRNVYFFATCPSLRPRFFLISPLTIFLSKTLLIISSKITVAILLISFFALFLRYCF